MQRFPNKNQAGFTLIEMMVATTVATLLMVLLAGVSSQLSKALTLGVGQNQTRNNARVAMNFMAREMRQAAISRQKTYPSASATTTASVLQFVVNPPDTVLGTPYKNPDAVFWQAPIATSTTSGDLAEVGYFVYRQRINNVYHSDLCRFFVNPGDLNYGIYTSPDQWVTSSLLSQFVPTKNNGFSGLFLENVIGLWVQPYNADGTPKTFASGRNYDSRKDGTTSDNLPPMVQVSMVLTSANAIKRLQDNIDVSGQSSADACYTTIKSHAGAPGMQQVISETEVLYFNVKLDNAAQ